MKIYQTVNEVAMNHRASTRWTVMALVCVAGLVAGAAHAQETGLCIRAEAPSPLVLPDGSIHTAGSIRICLTNKINPVRGWHTIDINGARVQFANSRIDRKDTGTQDVQPFLEFGRGPGGEWYLGRYTISRGTRVTSYWFALPNGQSFQDSDIGHIQMVEASPDAAGSRNSG